MSSLQKVNLGTPPKAEDGDPVRTANVKANENVDVLNAQSALTSAAQLVDSPQTLTADLHLGRRVNISLAAAGVVQMPDAASCGADGVVLLRNIGTTIATLASKTGSGDSVALSKLNPGEAVLMDTDGVHAWTVLMRGRTNSDNETVNGNCVVGGNETVGGTLGVIGTGTFSGALSVLGIASFGSTGQASISATGAYSGTGAAYSGNVTVGGTLGVTGAATVGSLTSAGTTLNGNTVVGTGAAKFTLSSDANNAYLVAAGAALIGSIGATTPTVILTNNTERARWDTGGKYLMGQVAYNAAQVNGGSAYPGLTLAATGQLFAQCAADANVYLSKASGQNSTFMAFCYGGFQIGGVTIFNASTVSYNTTSDYRLKTTIGPVSDALERICAIPTYRGYFDADGPGAEQDIALAHEIQEQVPAAVTGDKDAVEIHPVFRDGYDPHNVQPSDVIGVQECIKPQQVDYSKLVTPLIAAVQQLSGRLASALARIDALESA